MPDGKMSTEEPALWRSLSSFLGLLGNCWESLASLAWHQSSDPSLPQIPEMCNVHHPESGLQQSFGTMLNPVLFLKCFWDSRLAAMQTASIQTRKCRDNTTSDVRLLTGYCTNSHVCGTPSYVLSCCIFPPTQRAR